MNLTLQGDDVCVLRVFTLILGSKKAHSFVFLNILFFKIIDLAYICAIFNLRIYIFPILISPMYEETTLCVYFFLFVYSRNEKKKIQRLSGEM